MACAWCGDKKAKALCAACRKKIPQIPLGYGGGP